MLGLVRKMIGSPRTKTIALAAVAVLAGVWLGRCAGTRPPIEGVVVDSANAERWRERADNLSEDLREREGLIERLRARISGLEARPPRTRTVYDTVIDVRSVPVFLGGVSSGGFLDLDVAIPDPSPDSVPMRRPETLGGIDLRECDRGFSFGVDEEGRPRVVCREAPFGHLGIFLRPGLAWDSIGAAWTPRLTAAAGLRWRKCYDWDACPWAIEATIDAAGRVGAWVEYTF